MIKIPGHWLYNPIKRIQFEGKWVGFKKSEISYITIKYLKKLQDEGKDPLEEPPWWGDDPPLSIVQQEDFIFLQHIEDTINYAVLSDVLDS